MTTPDPQDYIQALEEQRNNALNEAVNLRAEVVALRRALDGIQIEEGGDHVQCDNR